MKNGPKILLFDIETAPSIVHTWGRWQQNITEKQIVQEGYILCWAAAWLGKDECFWDAQINYPSLFKKDPTDDSKVVASLADLLEEAHIVVTHNGDRFDLTWINTQLVLHGYEPIPPMKSIDTCKIAQGQFRFPSSKLESIANYLNLGFKKMDAGGWQTWIDCMRGDKKAWDRMIQYNIQDINVLEEVYMKLRPFIKNHPNIGLYLEDEEAVCPACGSEKLKSYKGYYYTSVAKYQRLKCMDCGKKNIRGRTNLFNKEKKKSLVTNAI